MRCNLTHREQRKAYNRRYYWLNHEHLLAYARWYAQSVRPLRIQFGGLPTDRSVDMYLWQLSQDRQQAQQAAVDILTLIVQGLTEDERRLLLAFESAGYDLAGAAESLGITETIAAQRMAAIRRCANGAREVIRRES